MSFIKKVLDAFRNVRNNDLNKKIDPPLKMISFYDENGTKFEISEQEYRHRVLPGIFERSWSNAHELCNAVLMVIEDGFLQESLEPAERLYEIDENRERGATILGIAYLKNELYETAQHHYEQYILNHGKSGVILTNLAKAYSYQGDEVRAKEVLWESVELYPNLDNAVQWIAAIARDSGGEKGYLRALEQISEIEGSWYADLWLARDELGKGNKNKALGRYTKILKLAPENADALFMISGDLGKNGFVNEVLDMIYPIYNTQTHGVGPAMNILQACAETRNFEKGSNLLSNLKALKRPDIKEHIAYYETVFAENA